MTFADFAGEIFLLLFFSGYDAPCIEEDIKSSVACAYRAALTDWARASMACHDRPSSVALPLSPNDDRQSPVSLDMTSFVNTRTCRLFGAPAKG